MTETNPNAIESILNEARVFPPPAEFAANAHIKSFEEYEKIERGIFEPFFDNFAEHFLKLTEGSEERAFELFFASLEEFLLEKD